MSKLVVGQPPRSVPQVPGLFTLAWLLFMQPATLHARLLACGINEPNAPGRRLWRNVGASRTARHLYILRMFTLLTLAMPLAVLVTVGFISPVRLAVAAFPAVAGGIAIGVAWGIAFDVTSGVAYGMGIAVAFSIAFTLGAGQPLNILYPGPDNVVIGVKDGVAYDGFNHVALKIVNWMIRLNDRVSGVVHTGIAESIALLIVMVNLLLVSVILLVTSELIAGVLAIVFSGVPKSGTVHTAFAVIFPVVIGVAGGVAGSVTFGVDSGVIFGLTFGLAAIMAVVLLTYRSLLYPIEILILATQYAWQRLVGRTTLQWSPVLFHELSYVPYVLLYKHILMTAEREPDLVRRVLSACAVAPGQRWIGRRAGSALQARELESLVTEGQFFRVVELQGEWLPGIQGASDVLLAFSETARYLAAATTATNPYHRLGHLQRANDRLRGLESQLQGKRSDEARLFISPLKKWQEISNRLQREAATTAAARLPNVFRSNDPLTPESGGELFRGRENLIRRIEETLVAPESSGSLVLLGPRRCGKSSLLRMLPAKLPDTVCVFFDLQDNPVSSPAAFWKALARRAYEQARGDRKLVLPQMPDGPVVEAAAQWLDQLETLESGYRVLLCIDEFERLADLYPGDRREVLRLLGLIRGTIQHKRRVRWLVAGVAPFDELDQYWSDHFINARELRVEHLDRPTSLELLTKPSCDFSDDILPVSVAEAVYDRTGGQPMLLQLYGSLIVERLNQQERRHATPEDVEPVEQEVLLQAGAYFRDTLNKCPDHVREMLRRLAFEESIDLERSALRWLRRRCLLTDENQISIPVAGRWIREYWEN